MAVYLVLFTVFTLGYILLALLLSPNKMALHHYHLSMSGYHWLIITVIAILALTSAAALYGSLGVKKYASIIKGSPDGQALNVISDGFLLLSIALPFSFFLSIVIGITVRHHTAWRPALTIINNFINLGLMAAAFFFIAMGSKRLFKLTRRPAKRLAQDFWVFLFIAVSSIYCYFLVIEPSQDAMGRRTYFLPSFVLLIAIAIPYLYVWYKGFDAAYNLYMYQAGIKGRLYKHALNYLATGIAVVIISSIASRLITTVSSHLSELSLTPTLVIIYALLVLNGIGYILIAVGARRLRRIEEV
jgi:hypothetical protein